MRCTDWWGGGPKGFWGANHSAAWRDWMKSAPAGGGVAPTTHRDHSATIHDPLTQATAAELEHGCQASAFELQILLQRHFYRRVAEPTNALTDSNSWAFILKWKNSLDGNQTPISSINTLFCRMTRPHAAFEGSSYAGINRSTRQGRVSHSLKTTAMHSSLQTDRKHCHTCGQEPKSKLWASLHCWNWKKWLPWSQKVHKDPITTESRKAGNESARFQ